MMRYRQCLCHNFPGTVATPSTLSSRLHLTSLSQKKRAVTRWATPLTAAGACPLDNRAELTGAYAGTTGADEIKC